jgi:thioester reductase-like protein
MGELRRIVCQKKYLLAVFVLLIANLFLFQYYQMDNLQALRDKETRQDTLDVWQEDQETAKEEFVSKIKEMDAQSETLSEISIFSDENSFVNQNIQRTKKDFARIKGVNIDVSHSEKAMSEFLEYDEILQNIKMRDKNDMEKEIGALKKAPDAVYIDSSNLSITQVKDKIIEIIKEKK